MKTARIIYITAWGIPLIIAALYLAGTIKDTEIHVDATTEYVLSLASVTITLAIAYFGLRLFHFKFIRQYLNLDNKANNEMESKHSGLRSYAGLCIAREAAILAVCLLDLATYYVLHSQSPLYLAGIMLISLLFCYPNNH